MADQEVKALSDANRLLANLQRASLDALRAQQTAWFRWQSVWPEMITDFLRWQQKLLQEASELMGAHARVLSEAADRVHASAEPMGQQVQEALSSSAARMRETVRRVA